MSITACHSSFFRCPSLRINNMKKKGLRHHLPINNICQSIMFGILQYKITKTLYSILPFRKACRNRFHNAPFVFVAAYNEAICRVKFVWETTRPTPPPMVQFGRRKTTISFIFPVTRHGHVVVRCLAQVIRLHETSLSEGRG